MKIPRMFLLWLPLIGSMTFLLLPASAQEPAGSNSKEPTAQQRVYYFEHRILPAWVHKSDGAFFSDLEQGDTKRLTEVAAELVGKDFAGEIKVRRIDAPTGILIVFPKPKKMPECFFAAVLKDGQHYRYVTLELTDDLFGDGTKSCLCEWSSGGDHLNFGPRKFTDEASFLSELKDRSHKETNPSPAAVTSPPKS
ncbi:MAG: hypothetical protein KGJ37_01480 [Verrucomicrobiota bacterium]|nr:hypothetical protein [Verrucomicrobiota bacterium]